MKDFFKWMLVGIAIGLAIWVAPFAWWVLNYAVRAAGGF